MFFRLNTFGDPDGEGTGWLKVEGKFQNIYSGPQCVLGLAANRDIYYRANMYDHGDGNFVPTLSHEGTHWVRIEQNRDSKIIFKHVECAIDSMWGVDKDNCLWYREMTNPDINTQREDQPKTVFVSSSTFENLLPNVPAHYLLNAFGDLPDFSNFKFPAKASTYKVVSGGWVLYSEPKYQGKVMYHFGSKCFSMSRVVG